MKISGSCRAYPDSAYFEQYLAERCLIAEQVKEDFVRASMARMGITPNKANECELHVGQDGHIICFRHVGPKVQDPLKE